MECYRDFARCRPFRSWSWGCYDLNLMDIVSGLRNTVFVVGNGEWMKLVPAHAILVCRWLHRFLEIYWNDLPSFYFPGGASSLDYILQYPLPSRSYGILVRPGRRRRNGYYTTREVSVLVTRKDINQYKLNRHSANIQVSTIVLYCTALWFLKWCSLFPDF